MNTITSKKGDLSATLKRALAFRAKALAPDSALVLPGMPNTEGGESGRFFLPNDAAFSEQFFSEPLTTYATGWKDPEDNQALVAMIAPDVEVGRRFEFKQGINAEEFLTEADDVRAIGSEFKTVKYTGTTQNGKTLVKGLSYRMDREQFPDPVKAQNLIVGKLLRRCWRNEAVRAITLLVASGVNTNVTWSSGSPTPEIDVETANDAAQLLSGLYNNRILYAKDAWTKRRKGLAGGNYAGAYSGSKMTIDDVVADLGLDKGMVSKSVYQSTATAKARLFSNLVLSFYAQDGVDTEDPTNLKRFWTPTEAGPFQVYAQPVGSEFIDITVKYCSIITAVSTVGVAKLTVS
ncbi:MAG: hypothetical protein LV479_08340 [Methylacidiphilales bacterium]|nr:hypothetical protein [Candidatus Methylacidiphilales bacterium]